MKFKKINDHTIECLVSKEDLDSYGITMADFLKDQEKVTEFMHKIVELSSVELDFNPSPGIVSMQISPAAEDGLCIIFSNQPPSSGLDILQYIREMLTMRDVDNKEGWKERSLSDSVGEGYEDAWGSSEDDSDAHGMTDLRDVLTHIRTNRTRTVKGAKKIEYPESAKLYEFESFSVLEQFCKAWNGSSTVKSQIYRAENSKSYFLIVERSKISKLEFAKLCRMLAEYGKYLTDSASKIDLLQEHGTCVIGKNAISMLHDL